jgi:hypothetical protein
VQGTAFDEEAFYEALAKVRALLIGRRALIALGAPILTTDYDIWLHIDDIEALNARVRDLDLFPNYPADEARKRGRYVLENDEKVDVLVARGQSTKDGEQVMFEACWERRQEVPYKPGLMINLPSIDDLVRTKRWSMRTKDLFDIEMLATLRDSKDRREP